MDINRVELLGRVSSEVTTRKTANGKDWLSFSVVTNEYNSKADVDKDKSIPTWTNVTVFNTNLVNKIRNVGIHQGSRVWLTGKLFVKQVDRGGYMCPYTSVAANELEVIKTKKEKEKMQDLQEIGINNNNVF